MHSALCELWSVIFSADTEHKPQILDCHCHQQGDTIHEMEAHQCLHHTRQMQGRQWIYMQSSKRVKRNYTCIGKKKQYADKLVAIS